MMNSFKQSSARLRAHTGVALFVITQGCQFNVDGQPSSNDNEPVASLSDAVSSNLALNKPATGIGYCGPAETPDKAVNGSVSGGTSDKWCSGATNPWLAVDLGSQVQIGQFVVRHAGAGGESTVWNTKDFDLQVSTDGTNYSTVASVRGNTANVTTNNVTPVTARYVRLAISAPTSDSDGHARIYEFEVYGASNSLTGGTGGTTGGTGGTTGGTGGTTGGTGGTTGGTGGTTGGTSGAGGSSGAWTLVWSDEFSDAGGPNSSNWGFEVGRVRNNEAQYYTANDLDNAHQDSGNLVITAIKENYNGASYTSASVMTKKTHTFQYGRLEVRAKIPGGVGTWPAIWLLGTNIDSVGWPKCGEIDMMENVGFEPNTVHVTLHTAADESGQHNAVVGVDQTLFHVYAMDWTAQELDFYIDGNKVYTYTNDGTGNTATWPYSQPFYLIINLAIGGTWGGQQGIDDSSFPHNYYIDYVRYYH